MNGEEALALLDERQETRWKLGLDRIEKLVESLGNPQDSFPVIHVAGTNGKGSFCMMLATVLQRSGLKVGLFTSPHLMRPTERIRIDGRPIPLENLGVILECVRAAEREESSYFELITAAAFLYFKKEKVDVAVIEVGLGGRLDATNVLRSPVLSVITSIDLDHIAQLGGSLGSIAAEKAGILKRGVPCICGEEKGEALEAIWKVAQSRCVPLQALRPVWRRIGVDWELGRQIIETPDRRLSVGLLGDAAAKNAVLVTAAVGALRQRGFSIDENAVKQGIGGVNWPGRFQVMPQGDGRTIICDGAHNVAAMESFISIWRKCPWQDDAVFLFGVLKDKDYQGMIRRLAPFAHHVLVTAPDSRRALASAEAARLFRAAGCPDVRIRSDARLALKSWRSSRVGTCAVVGSFYLVGEVLGRLESIPA